MKVYMHLADGFEEIEAISVVDILRRADIDVTTVSVTGQREVVGAHKIPVIADVLFENVDYINADMMVLPGGGQGTKMLGEHTGLKNQMSSFSVQDKWIAAICAAPSILGKMGLLEGKMAVCFPGFEQDLRGAVNPQENVVVDGKIITSRGPGTAFEFGLKIVEIIKGIDFANKVKAEMLIG